MKIIPTSVPVFIENLQKQENCTYSTAQLKVFYVGETPDRRLFTKSFAEQVVTTLYSCPVVGFYSDEVEDFKGHNKTQYVYGHVPETATFEWKTDDDGNTWLITPVILYTERDDNIGEVAKKIVGKQHSLELNPKTLKYKINRDQYGEFKNIEMTYGEFIGLSVLGDNEQPAFTNSAFFTNNQTFAEFAEGCRSSFDRFLNFLDNKDGGKIEIMDFNFLEYQTKIAEMAQRTMQEFQQSIYQWLAKNGIDGWLLENTNEYAVIDQWIDNGWRTMKYTVTYLDKELMLENPVQVYARYLTQEQIDEGNFANKQPKEEEPKDPSVEEPKDTETEPLDDNQDDDKKKNSNGACDDEDKKGKCTVDTENADSEGVPNATEITVTQEKSAAEQVGETAPSASVAALLDSERVELEEFRRQEKINLINEYTGDVEQEQLDNFVANINNYSKEQLINELNSLFRQAKQKQKETETTVQSTPVTTFQIIPTVTDYDARNPADVIKKYKR